MEKKRSNNQNKGPNRKGPSASGGSPGGQPVARHRATKSTSFYPDHAIEEEIGPNNVMQAPPVRIIRLNSSQPSNMPQYGQNCNGNRQNGTGSRPKSDMKTSASTPCIKPTAQQQGAFFDKHMDGRLVQEGLANKTLIQSKIRINQRSYEDAFVTDPNGGSDIFIKGLKDRNRALNNDIVAVKLKEKSYWKFLEPFKNQIMEIVKEFQKNNPPDLADSMANSLDLGKKPVENSRTQEWEKDDLANVAPSVCGNPQLLAMLKDEWFQRTGIVVSILEKKNSRYAAGHLRLFQDKSREWAYFSPNDSRLPRMKVKMSDCPRDFYTNSDFYANTLFIVQIVDMPINSRYAIGELKKSIGAEGDIEAETEAILIENGIDYSEFDSRVNESLPATPWHIPDSEFSYRRDLRSHCIFTIDPATARDLDDALHVIKLNDDLYEVGVHIADVSYFVKENSPIDLIAVERTTSVYLVQQVIPMLPRLLCEELCSLNPAVDRLTFSVIWKVNSAGDILDEWFGRTVINSAVKLSYDHAQMFIEEPDKYFDLAQFPTVRPEFDLNKDIKPAVLNLNAIAVKLRQKRFANGCLVLNQPKLNFVLNREAGCMPYGYSIYQQKDSNRLVEEFMLLANIAVAHRIYSHFPNKAILRRHPKPNNKLIEQLGDSIRACGDILHDCDISSSNNIQAFLQRIQQTDSSATKTLTLTCLLSKTMQLAQYFCTGIDLDKELYHHYGLAVPLYTHFTSPIRRYPDILVHRLLAASLNYEPETRRELKLLQGIAENCNDKKYAAKTCSERSSEMFFSLFVHECGPLEELGCVTQIKDHSFDVLLVNLGICKRIYCDKLEISQESIEFSKNHEVNPTLSFTWMPCEAHPEPFRQTLEMFSTVAVVLIGHENDKLRFNAKIKHPKEGLNKPVKSHSGAQTDTDLLYQRIDLDPYICD